MTETIRKKTNKMVYVMVSCNYFRQGMKSLFSDNESNFIYINSIDGVRLDDDETLTILLVLDLTSIDSLRNFKQAIDALPQFRARIRIGVLVSKLSAWLTWYIYRKLHGKVTFFNSHNLKNGLFKHNFETWLNGKTFRPMHVVQRFRDDRYGLSMKEWIALVIPLSGETITDISQVAGISVHSLYQTRQNALHKIGLASWRDFAEKYINGKIRIENDMIRFTKM